MYIIKNVIKNLGRNKERNILLAVIMLMIIVTSAISIIINTTTSEIVNEYKTTFGSEAKISVDSSKMNANTNMKQITVAMLESFADSKLIKDKIFSADEYGCLKSLHPLDEESSSGLGAATRGESENPNLKSDQPQVKLTGTTDKEINDDFKNELRKIIKGEIYKNKNECIVSEDFAKLNNLSIGDEITVQVCSYEVGKERSFDKLKVTGIYSDETMNGENQPKMYQYMKCPLTNRNNEIITSFDTLTNLKLFTENKYASANGKFILTDPSKLTAFQKELRGKGLPTYYKVTTDEAGYNKMVGPVESLARTTNVFLIVVLVLGGSVLLLLSGLAIRERKYEIGVLRVMGMKKIKVAIGLLIENLLIIVMCLIVGLGIAGVAAKPVGNYMLKNQIEQADKANKQKSKNNEGMAMMSLEEEGKEKEPLSDIDIKLSENAIVKIIIVSLSLAGVASVIGVISVTKYEPRKILTERN